MGRARLLVVLSIAVLAALAAIPAAAPAASFTWDLTHDFTTTSPGANPDKDSYGGHPWSYEEGGRAGCRRSTPSINGGLAGWRGLERSPFVAINAAAADHKRLATYAEGRSLQPTTTSPAVDRLDLSGVGHGAR